MVLSSNIIAAKNAVAQRFRKLYRKLFILFLQDDFIYTDDYRRELAQLDTRLKVLETAIIANTKALLELQLHYQFHVHGVSSAPGSTGPSGYQPSSFPAANPPAGPGNTVHQKPLAKSKATQLAAETPGVAPLSDSLSAEGVQASVQSTLDVGF